MFSHVMIGTNDLEKAKAFYDALLGTLGVAPAKVDRHRIFYRTKTGVFRCRSRSMASQRPQPMAALSVSLVAPLNKQTRGTPLASPMAGPPAKSRRVFAKYPQANSM